MANCFSWMNTLQLPSIAQYLAPDWIEPVQSINQSKSINVLATAERYCMMIAHASPKTNIPHRHSRHAWVAYHAYDH